jgi:hypothetical protein
MRYVKLMRRYSKSKRRESVKTLRALNWKWGIIKIIIRG